MHIRRPDLLQRIRRSVKDHSVTALLGPRQCGKTTLARELHRQMKGSFFDLENRQDLARLQDPVRALGDLRGLVVLDEVQKQTDLLETLRVLADRRPRRASFLILGSASPDLMHHSSQSLAGRVHFIDMQGFDLAEAPHLDRLWLRGGFPSSYLAASGSKSFEWREDFLKTFLERDIPQWGIRVPAATLRRFWGMLAHYHGQTWNASEIASSLGTAHTTTQHYLDILTGAFMVRQLPPWHENMGKRLVKAPKVYIRDSGLFHSLMSLETKDGLYAHPKFGASWEGFALEHLIRRVPDRHAYFWGTHAGAELDLLIDRDGKRWGFEFKVSEAPSVTKSMRIALKDLKLQRLWVVYPGSHRFAMSDLIEAIPLAQALQLDAVKE
ncbi:MAG TPA: hypothetical protein DCZ01_10145 [Elusimicrobia bacterium]|nr:MAG: hypothetical protein A2X37_07185 [Elusimicrobia bacterium GWA2_66_18]OGR70885.1 MAG: hypothetical protein A2X40_04945 [Elusimicrobia bacterium GWC2_65_9]HAZ08859.1 hypothetical protein [Elusimicrobiota bacterium]